MEHVYSVSFHMMNYANNREPTVHLPLIVKNHSFFSIFLYMRPEIWKVSYSDASSDYVASFKPLSVQIDCRLYEEEINKKTP